MSEPVVQLSSIAAAGVSVDATSADLMSWLPMFDSPVAMTVNSAVSMTETRAYAPPSLTGESVVLDPHRVNLRLDRAALARVVASQSDQPRDPDAVQLVDGNDRLLHRGFVSSPDDQLALRSLTVLSGCNWTPGEPKAESRRAKVTGADRSRLAGASADEHVDEIISDVRRLRGSVLTGLGREIVSRVPSPEVLHMLFHLGQDSVPLTFAVPVPGLAHLRSGRIDTMRQLRLGVSLSIGGCTVAIDQQMLGPAWVVRPPSGPAFIEQHDVWGRCVLVVMSGCERHLEPDAAIRWEHLTAMLSISHLE